MRAICIVYLFYAFFENKFIFYKVGVFFNIRNKIYEKAFEIYFCLCVCVRACVCVCVCVCVC